MYNSKRGTREAIARDGTSMLEAAKRMKIPPEVLEHGMSAHFLSSYTRFSTEEIYEMGRD